MEKLEIALRETHNLLRWALVLFGLLTLITAARGLSGRKDFNSGDKRTALYLLISADLQLLIGLALYFMKGYNKMLAAGGEVMKNAVMRFWAVEHGVTMIVAILLIHIGYSAAKGNKPAAKKFKTLFWCTLIAMILIAAMVPWPFRAPGIARPWFPGMGM